MKKELYQIIDELRQYSEEARKKFENEKKEMQEIIMKLKNSDGVSYLEDVIEILDEAIMRHYNRERVYGMEADYYKRDSMTDEQKQQKDERLRQKIMHQLDDLSNRVEQKMTGTQKFARDVRNAGKKIEKWGEKVKNVAKSAARKISGRSRGE